MRPSGSVLENVFEKDLVVIIFYAIDVKDEEFYEGMGVFFVALAQDLGYGMLLSCLGRCFRDFFVNLDNLHDYLKFTFPRWITAIKYMMF